MPDETLQHGAIVVTGAAGQLGRDVVLALAANGRTVAAFDRSNLDITDAVAVRSALGAALPSAVINCAAYTAVDDCESNAAAAYAVNDRAVRHLAEACDHVGAHLVHVSTDYVFDGTLDRPYREDDAVNPVSVYGQSKVAGEAAAAEVLGDAATIVRTSWVCGEFGNNMVKLVRRLGAAGNPMAFVDDQRGAPTFTADLAPALIALADDRPGGIFHLTNAGVVSWFDFVAEILEASGYDPALVSPISTAELDPPRPAPRPANGALENHRWSASGREPLRDHRAALADLVARL